MAREMIEKLACLLLVSLMLNLSISPAFAEGMPAEDNETNSWDNPDFPAEIGTGPLSAMFADGEGEIGSPELVETPKTAEFSCSTPETESYPGQNVLLPNEVAKLKRKTEVENKGFSVDNINSGRGTNEDRDVLENSVVIQEKDDGSSIANELPAGKMDLGEISPWFNQFYPGPFAFGVSLSDTIRIGQCRNLSELEASERGCPMQDKQLAFRNSGQGITSDIKLAWSDLKDWVTPESISSNKGNYSTEQLEKLQVNVASETDLNSLESKSYNRQVEQIPNSVKVEEFTAKMATTGDDAGSLISIYSMFDKYFNSWFSTEMVVSVFGPTLVGQAKKYSGWLGRRSGGWPWGKTDSQFMQWFRRTFADPEGVYGQARLQRMMTRTDKYGFGEAWTKGIESTEWDSGYAFVKGGSFRKNINDWTKAGGYLDEMKDPVTRGEFFKQIRDLRGYGHANLAIWNQSREAYEQAAKKFGTGSAEARAALMDYATTNAKIMRAADMPYLRLDALELWTKEETTRLYDIGIKQKGIEGIIPLTGDSKHIGIIAKGFEDGKWGSADFPYETFGDSMKFYKVSQNSEFIDSVPIDDIRKNMSRYVDKAALTEKGDMIKIDSGSIGYIAKESAGTGKVKIYRADWQPINPETPEMFAKRLTDARSNRISKTLPANMDRFYNTLVERNFAGQSRRYFNILDKAFAQEQEILKSYFSVKGGAKWTLFPFLYWEGKRGFGFEAMSAFQLPDEWKTVEVYTDDEEIFDDAFIDIFAQHGSDEGEIFVQVLNKLPWKMAYNYVSEKFSPVHESYEKMTDPTSAWRRKVENVAYFTSSQQDCATCSVTLIPKVLSQRDLIELQEKGRGEATISFVTTQNMQSYFLEDILDDKVKEEGTTLIAYGFHTNIKGESLEGDDNIDLVEAAREKKTCRDAVQDIAWGVIGKIPGVEDDPHRAGAILAFGESLGYLMFMWSGILGSVIQQTLIVPQLQDCVDDTGGYYLHMYAAYDKSKENVETPNDKSSEVAGDAVQNISQFVLGRQLKPAEDDDDEKPPVDEEGQPFTPTKRIEDDADRPVFDRYDEGDKKGLWEAAKDRLASEMERVSTTAKSKEILQLDVETMGETTGTVFFEKMFFFWFKGLSQSAVYDEHSKSIFEDNDKDVSVIVDKEAGVISVKQEGKPAEPVITSEDHVRLSSPDGRVPAEVIPQRIGRIVLPDAPGIPLFEMDYRGRFNVLDQAVLDCIKQNVLEQTGLPLTVDDITDAFGPVKAIVTDVYPTITGSEKEKSITANGSPREIVFGENARVLVMSDMNTTLLNSREVPAGNFKSAQFKNGVILFKPASEGKPAELLIWLRYHERSILTTNDVRGLKATLADPLINPETGCPEPAIDLEAIPNLAAGDDSAITQRVNNFNTSIKKMGPFQIFDTERHRFVFYSEKTSPGCDPSQEGCCQDRVSIIDKQTGEVYDQEIVGGIQQTPTGIKFETADGKDHTLDFSADNGVPKISYNGMTPETLTMARGPNGGFWYDPDEGTWQPYNAQLLPLIEAFKKGFDTRHREDCSSSTMPGSNTMNVQLGGAAETPFNLPSMPLHPAAMLLFIVSLMAVICIARLRIERKFKT